MAERLREQHTVYYNEEQNIPRRSSATQESTKVRRNGVPTSTQDTDGLYTVSSTPRSVMRHRPIGDIYIIPFTDGSEMQVTQSQLEDLPESYQRAAQLVTPQIAAPRQRRQPHPKRPVQDDTVYEMPPARTDVPPQKKARRFHLLFWIGIALVIMVVGYILFNIVANWWQVTQDDWHYGRPRTYQVEVNVGHGTAQDPYSHFIAQNLNGRIVVIEEQGDDATHAKVYVGPALIGKGQELTPVTLSFEEVNHDGHTDMIIHIGDGKVIFLNTGTGFKPAPNQ